MQKNYPLFIISIVLMLFSCSKNENSQTEEISDIKSIDIKVKDGSLLTGLIDEVRLERIGPTLTPIETLAKAPYGNGNITMNLPAEINTSASDKADFNYQPEDDEIMVENTLKASDNNLRIVFPFFYTYKGSSSNGVLYLISLNANQDYGAMYLYADRSATVKGKTVIKEKATGDTETTTYNLVLKKGWNIFYSSSASGTHVEEYVSTAPLPNMPLDWYFLEIDDNSNMYHSSGSLPPAKKTMLNFFKKQIN